MARHLWTLSKKSDSLWVKWIHSYVIKRKCLWHMRLPQDSSWTIRKLFKLRDQIQPLIKYVVGNGSKIFLWLDNWHTEGPLYKVFGEAIVRNVGSSLLAKVSSIIHNEDWHWPRQRTYSVKSVLEALRTPNPKVPWASIVWFKQNIPRWAFIMWLVCWGRLSTNDRLLSWRLVADPMCVLCGSVAESHGVGSGDSLGIPSSEETGFPSMLYKLAMAGSVYYIWKARNECIFCNKHSNLEGTMEQLVLDVRDRVCSWKKVGSNGVNQDLCKAWNIYGKILL
ncbi:uncharacterized protein LOC131309479 [Rhododendron vialii]|uniref:uncharacterized protein LOC131309479 n=1 Tax=Rhododendron vialii TaxID=182163 RepID=UPI00265F956C|nr:uncharacterized protein LOC131309479 [Rhododendron vialii]